MKNLGKFVIYNLINYSGAAGLHKLLSKPVRGIVLAYHRVSPITENDLILKEMITPPSIFETQMRHLSKNYRVASVDQYLEGLSSNRNSSENLAVVTFDDAYADSFKYALPVLKKYRIPVMIFVPTAFIETGKNFWWDVLAYLLTHTRKDRLSFVNAGHNYSLGLKGKGAIKKAFCNLSLLLKYCDENEMETLLGAIAGILDVKVPQAVSDLLTWDNMLKMAEHGVSFGAHTHVHRALSSLNGLRLKEEIVGPKHILESRLGSKITSFAYPYGEKNDLSAEAADLISMAGYNAAFTMVQRRIGAIDNPFLLPRIGVGGNDNIAVFKMKLSGLVPLGK